jgi:acylphosphatase
MPETSLLEPRMRLTALVSGQVQGVGYRHFVQRRAENLRLTGYTENLSDGRVEVIAEGEKSNLEQLLHFLKQGSTHAVVKSVEVQWADPSGLTGFFVY